MSAPGGLCGSCGLSVQWCIVDEQLLVRCRACADLFEEPGMVLAGREVCESGDAVMPDGRPVRPIEEIVQNAHFIADCEGV